jgi:crotonobetainyl-CoA:carnitine CoA-transferase CaiB-like acyl-CoA transferase
LARKISTNTNRTKKRVGKGRTASALRGIKVLDMTWVGPGPFCTTLLGDLGADVIKIHEAHPEQRGGLILQVFPNSSDFPGFRNCKTLGLNLKTKEGRKIFYDLSKTADVVIEGSRPGVMKRLGIDYATIKKINPAIVYASLTGYGQDGPYRDLVGHDINYISIGGLLGITGTPGGEPIIPGIPVADFAGGGLSAAVAILAALMAREKTGKGQFIDVSITDKMVGLMSIWINPYLTWGIACQRGETWLSGQWPWYNVYETKDRKYISIGALEAGFYANLCHLLGREDFIEHQYAEGEKRDEIFHYFKKTFKTKTRDEWVTILRQEDTCVAPVYSIEEMVSDPQLLTRGMIKEMPHPVLGKIKQVGFMFKLLNSPCEIRNWSTRFGQHTTKIMRTLGYETASIKALRQKGVIS